MNQQEYNERIQILAEECIEEANEEGVELSGVVFDAVDASRMVFVTDRALEALQHSHNGPQEWQHLVADGDSWQEAISALAFDAVRTDVFAEIAEIQD